MNYLKKGHLGIAGTGSIWLSIEESTKTRSGWQLEVGVWVGQWPSGVTNQSSNSKARKNKITKPLVSEKSGI